MNTKLTLEEIEDIKVLEGLGYNIRELAHAIFYGREADTYSDITAQIKRLLE